MTTDKPCIPECTFTAFLQDETATQYYLTALHIANTAFADAFWGFFKDNNGCIKIQRLQKFTDCILKCTQDKSIENFLHQLSTDKNTQGEYRFKMYLHGDSAIDFLHGDAIKTLQLIDENIPKSKELLLEYWQYDRVLPIDDFTHVVRMLQSACRVRNTIIHKSNSKSADFEQALYFIGIFIPPKISNIFFTRVFRRSHSQQGDNSELQHWYRYFSEIHKRNMHEYHQQKMSRQHQRVKLDKGQKKHKLYTQARTQTRDFRNKKHMLQHKYRHYVNDGAGLSLWNFVKYYNFIGVKNLDFILKKMGYEQGTADIENQVYNPENPSFTFDIIGAYMVQIHIGFILYTAYRDIYNHILITYFPHDKKGKPQFAKDKQGKNKDTLENIVQHPIVAQQAVIKRVFHERYIVETLKYVRNNIQHNRIFDMGKMQVKISNKHSRPITVVDIFSIYIQVCKGLKLHTARQRLIQGVYNVCKKQDYAVLSQNGKKVKHDEREYYTIDSHTDEKIYCRSDEMTHRKYVRKFCAKYNRALQQGARRNGYKT